MKIAKTTIFEVNDDNRQFEYTGGNYFQPFLNFLNTLGLQDEEIIETSYSGSEKIKIKGVELYVDTSSASYKVKNQFTREHSVRKSTNRYIAIRKFSHTSESIMRVYFNKEMDQNLVVKKINSAIDEQLERQKSYDDQVSYDEIMIEILSSIYLEFTTFIKSNVKNISFNQGEIGISILNVGYLIVDTDHNIKSYSPEQNKIGNIDTLISYFDSQSQAKGIVIGIYKEMKEKILSEEQKSWIKECHDKFSIKI